MGEQLPTVAAALSAYLMDAALEGRPRRSIATYAGALKLLRDCDCPVPSLGRTLRETLHARVRLLSPNSVGVVVSAHRSFIAYCLARGWLLSDPLAGLKPPKVRRQPQRYLSAPERAAVLAACGRPLERAAVLLLATCGLRASETCGLRWRDVDLAGATIRLQALKGGDFRELPVQPMLAAALIALGPAADGPVLGIGPHQLWKMMRLLGQRCGIRLHPHMLRHTWALSTIALTDQGTLQTLGGWQNAEMARYYARSALRQLALERARQVDLEGQLFGD